MALTTIMLRRALPDHGRQLSITYRAQLRGVLDVARAEPALRWRSLIAACGFGSFGCFWTTVTFLLASPQYGFSQLEIGLFALVGAAGRDHLAGGRPGHRRAPGAALAGQRRWRSRCWRSPTSRSAWAAPISAGSASRC